MARAIDSEVAYQFLTEQLVKETGAFSKGVNKGLNIARSAIQNPDSIPTITPPNEALTLEDAKKERYIWFTPLNDWAKVTPFGVLFFGSEELMNWETLCEEWGYRFKAYRRPPEGEA